MEHSGSYTPCRIIEQHRTGRYLVCRFAADWAQAARPGQFLMVRVPGRSEHLLCRPFCISRTGDGWAEFAAAIVGSGTAQIASALDQGDSLEILGPLGRGFNVSRVYRKIALVGGGVGIAELCLLARELHVQGRPAVFFAGARCSEDLLYLDEVSPSVLGIEVATEDGSAGVHGLVTLPLQAYLDRLAFDLVAACGPMAMLRAVAAAADAAGIESLVALEERMACGVGACFGCAVPLEVKGKLRMVRVCREGPVFRGKSFLGGISGGGRD